MLRAPGQASESPPTNNPVPSALKYTPAPENRDAAANLRALVERSGVQVDPSRPLVDVRKLTFEDALRASQQGGPELLSAEEDYLLSAISLLVERHLWGPRFFNDTKASIAGAGSDGHFEHAASLINTLRATQRLPYGGSVEAAWVWDATEQLRGQATGRYEQSSRIVLSGSVPLLRGAGQVAREDLIQSERDLVYAARDFERFRRKFLVSIAGDYFDLLQTKASISNQEKQLESLRLNERRTRARVDAGKLEAFEVGIAASEVLSAEASLAGLRERYALQLESFKIRLGLPVSQTIDVEDDDIGLSEPAADIDEVTNAALDYRLDLQNQRDRLDDARRRFANARDALLPDLNLDAQATIPTDPDASEGGVRLSPDDASYSAAITLSLPLDREQERLRLRGAMVQVQKQQRDLDQSRDNIIVAVRSAVRNVELARFQLTLAEEQVRINQQRKRGQELREDTVTTQDKLNTEIALLDSANRRDRAKTNLRNAVLNYLLESDQLRVARDGTIEPIPGLMKAKP